MLPDRFMAKVSVSPAGCWIWTGATRNGYGAFYFDGKMRSAHRYAYEVSRETIPAGLELDHLCRVRTCVNPDHLEPVTSSENKRRSPLVGRAAAAAGRATIMQRAQERKTCLYGHPWNEANTYRRPDGGRNCRTCNRNYGYARMINPTGSPS